MSTKKNEKKAVKTTKKKEVKFIVVSELTGFVTPTFTTRYFYSRNEVIKYLEIEGLNFKNPRVFEVAKEIKATFSVELAA